MRNLIFTFSLFASLIFSLMGCQFNSVKEEDNDLRGSEVMVENSRIERFHSKKMGDYKITLHIPATAAPKEGWPILYLLDGDSYFLAVNNILSTQVCDRCLIQEGIVVAIDYFGESRRSFDFLPKPDKLIPEILPDGSVNRPDAYGGADDFWHFIEEELKPVIEERFPINQTKQSIFGHSYGGLWVLHTFLTKPTTFNNYLISSPSLWFSDGFLFSEMDKFEPPQFKTPVHLLLSVGGAEQSLLPAEKQKLHSDQRLAHKRGRKMVDNAKKLDEKLQQLSNNNFIVNFEIYAKQTHQTVPFIALQDGIQVAFAK